MRACCLARSRRALPSVFLCSLDAEATLLLRRPAPRQRFGRIQDHSFRNECRIGSASATRSPRSATRPQRIGSSLPTAMQRRSQAVSLPATRLPCTSSTCTAASCGTTRAWLARHLPRARASGLTKCSRSIRNAFKCSTSAWSHDRPTLHSSVPSATLHFDGCRYIFSSHNRPRATQSVRRLEVAA